MNLLTKLAGAMAHARREISRIVEWRRDGASWREAFQLRSMPAIAGGANEILTNKTVLKRGNGAVPEIFTTVPGIFNIDPPKPKRPEVDVTDLADAARRKQLGIVDNGQMTAQYHWIDGDAQQDGIKADFDAKTRRNYRLEYPDKDGNAGAGGTDTFGAYVMGVDRGPIALDGSQTRTATLLIDGVITEA